jgi:hypothetical protein
MMFVNFLYLAAIGAVAGPVLLHLLLRQRPQRQVLPTLRFLTAAAPQSYAMHKFKNLLLLISRMLLILLIALAFARPFFDSELPPDMEETANHGMVLVLDTSFSMRAADTWDEAVTRAQNSLKSLPKDSPAALIVFDQNPHVSVSETRDLSRIETELRAIEPGFKGTDLSAALRAGAEAGKQLNAYHTKIVVISDYQRSGLRQALAPLPMKRGVEFETVPVGDDPPANFSVASGQVIAGDVPGKQSVLLEIRRFGEGVYEGEIELFDDGTSLGIQEFKGDSDQSFVEFVIDDKKNDAIFQAEVRVSDSLMEDNRYNVLMEVYKPVPLLILQQTGQVQFASDANSHSPAGVNRFVKAAVQACDGLIDATWFDGGTLTVDELIQFPVVLALDIDAFGDQAVAAIEAYVKSGGALVLFPGNGEMAAFTSFSGSTIDGWKQLDRKSSEYRLVSTIRKQGPMDMLGSTGESVLGHPKVFRYLNVSPESENEVATVAQFDNGSPFLLERRMGDGLVYVFTTHLDSNSTDFVLRASFAPFLYELMSYATHETQARRRYSVGDAAPAPLLRGVHTVHTPKQKIRINQDPLTFSLPGEYTLESDNEKMLISVNIDPLESDMTRLNRTEIDGIRNLRVENALDDDGSGTNEGIDVNLPPDEKSKFWRNLLVTALGLMVFEMLLASRTTR